MKCNVIFEREFEGSIDLNPIKKFSKIFQKKLGRSVFGCHQRYVYFDLLSAIRKSAYIIFIYTQNIQQKYLRKIHFE